jgi:hypothetical protein
MTKSSSSAPTLAELQTWLRWAITDPRSVGAALEGAELPQSAPEGRFDEPLPRCLPAVVTTAELAAASRLQVYANSYWGRVCEAVEADFPRLRACLATHPQGDLFSGIVMHYLAHHPSQTFNLGEMARFLPDFLATHGLLDEMPYVADIARTEWLLQEAFYAPESEGGALARLQALSPEDWPQLRLTLPPSMRCFESVWNLDEIWADGATPVAGAPALLVLHRSRGRSSVRRLQGGRRALFEALHRGESFGEICAALAETDGDLADVMPSFAEWAEAGLIV